jgi:hypothetical protein
MFYNFQKIPISINNKSLIIESAELSDAIELKSKYSFDNKVSQTQLPESNRIGNLKISYYLTGYDYLKQYIYSDDNSPISGNIAGLRFNYGFLSDYSINVEPNLSVIVNANITFYDKVTGTFSAQNAVSNTGFILRHSDTQIINLNNYTVNTLNNITHASLDYSCNLTPNFNYYDTGAVPNIPDNVFIGERTINVQINSDDTRFNLPLSGEKYGINFMFSNPTNTGLYETFGCSGLINSKTFNINANKPHSHSIKLSQNHVNKQNYIYSVQTGTNTLTINFNTGGFPLFSRDGTINYLENVSIGDIQLTGYTVNRTQDYDQIVAPIPYNILNDKLLIQTNYGNYIWPNIINFQYPNITITGISNNSGKAGDTVTISGTNFYRITDVLFGGAAQSQFQVKDAQTIQATIPLNGFSYPITVASHQRNTSGQSNTYFYNPTITYLSPTTGQWKDTLIISGYNFSGVTGIYFNNVPAFSFIVNSNNKITVQSPETGQGFSSGYLNIYGTGGYTQSISVYNPTVPIYSFSPTSGTPGTGVVIYTKIDTGYLYPISGGYMVKIAGNDCVFYPSGGNSTGILTGVLPLNDIDDYIYIYQPNGISTYPSNQKLTVVGYPSIDYISPIVTNQYAQFNLLLEGKNLKYFYGQPYYLSFAGGISGDFQSFGSTNFNYSANGSYLLSNYLNITGNTGYYDVSIRNAISSYTLTSGLMITQGVNLASKCSASYLQGGVNSANLAIDGSTDSYAYAFVYKTGELGGGYSLTSTGGISIVPVSVPNMNISMVVFNPSYTGNGTIHYNTSDTVTPTTPPTGRIIMYMGTAIAYDSNYIIASGFSKSFTTILTGITKVNILGVGHVNNINGIPTDYLGIQEVLLY